MIMTLLLRSTSNVITVQLTTSLLHNKENSELFSTTLFEKTGFSLKINEDVHGTSESCGKCLCHNRNTIMAQSGRPMTIPDRAMNEKSNFIDCIVNDWNVKNVQVSNKSVSTPSDEQSHFLSADQAPSIRDPTNENECDEKFNYSFTHLNEN
jgi:hypothetical protein